MNLTLAKGTPLEKTIFKDLDLKIVEGELTAIIGVNGSGKSTLFNVICGKISPQSGQVFIDTHNIKTLSDVHKSRLIAKVEQDPKVGTIENMTLLENLAFAYKRGQSRKLSLFSNAKRIALFKEKLAILNMGLENRLNEPVKHLSGGQRQALSLIMCLLKDSKILLLDEMTAALDPASSQSIMELTSRLVKEHKQTCIMITHDMKQAIEFADRILLLKNGSFIKSYDNKNLALSVLELQSQFERH